MGIANGYFDTNFADWQTAGDVCDANITPYSGASQIDLIEDNSINLVVSTSTFQELKHDQLETYFERV